MTRFICFVPSDSLQNYIREDISIYIVLVKIIPDKTLIMLLRLNFDFNTH